jgi:hypothetical protein
MVADLPALRLTGENFLINMLDELSLWEIIYEIWDLAHIQGMIVEKF